MMDEETTDQNLQDELDDIRQIDQILHEDSDAEDYIGSDLEIDEQKDCEDDDVHEQFSPSGFTEVTEPVPEDEPDIEAYLEADGYADVDSDVSVEELLLLNRKYQGLIVMNLNRVREALEKNREMQATKLDLKKRDCVVVLKKFMPPYFKDKFDRSPRDNEDTISIKQAGYPVPTDLQYPRQWTKQDLENLTCGVKADGLERLMTPLINQREVQEKRLWDAVIRKDKQAAREVKKEIAEIDKKLNSLKSCPLETLLGSVDREVDWQKVAMRHLDGSRTAEECRAYWQVAAHPSFKSSWTPAEEKRLKEIVKKQNCRDWNAIAAKLGTGHSAFECIQKYQQKLNTSLYKRSFTAEEDKKIVELAEKYRVGHHIPWSKVAYFLKDRKTNQISFRWDTKLDPSLRFGKWSKWEDELLVKLIQKQKNEVIWVKVAMELEGRSASQCRTRWLNSLNPELRRGRFSAAEDLILLEAVKKCGTGRWSKIADAMKKHPNLAPGRNAAMFMWRYRYLVKYFVDDERKSFNERRRQERMKILEKEMTKVSGGSQTDVVALPQEETYRTYLKRLDPSTFLDRLILATKQKVDELGEDAHRANVSEVRGNTYFLPRNDPPTTKDGIGDEPAKDLFIKELKDGVPLTRHKTVASYLKGGATGASADYPKDMHLETQILKELFPQKTLQPEGILQRATKSFLKLKRCNIIATEVNKKKSISWSTAISVLMLATKVNFFICRGIIHHSCKLRDIKFPINAKRHLDVTTPMEKKPRKLRKLSEKTSPNAQGKKGTNEGLLDGPNNAGFGALVSGDTTGQLNVDPETKIANAIKQSQSGKQPTSSESDEPSKPSCVLKISDSVFLVVSNSKSQTQNISKPNLVTNLEKQESTRIEERSQLNREGIVHSNIKTNVTSQVTCGIVANAITSTNTYAGSGVMQQGKFKPYSPRYKSRGGGKRSDRVAEVARLSETEASPAEETWISQVVRPPSGPSGRPASPDPKCSACANKNARGSLDPAQEGCHCFETVIVAEVCSDGNSTSVNDRQQEGQEDDAADSVTPSNSVPSGIAEDGRSPSDTQMKIREDGKNVDSENLSKETFNQWQSVAAPPKDMETETRTEVNGEGFSSARSESATGGTDDICSGSKDQQGEQHVALNLTVGKNRDQTSVPVSWNIGSEHGNTLNDIHRVPADRDFNECVGKDISKDSQKKNQSVEEVVNDITNGKTDKESEKGAPTCVSEQSHPCPGGTHGTTCDEKKQEENCQVINPGTVSGNTSTNKESCHGGMQGGEGSSLSESNVDKDQVKGTKGKGTKGGCKKRGKAVMPSLALTRPRRKTAPKPGDFVILSSDDDDDDYSNDDEKSGNSIKSSAKGDMSVTADKPPESMLKSTSSHLEELPGTSSSIQPSLFGLSPDTKVLIGPNGTVIGILPAVLPNNNTVFPTRSQFANITQPHTSLNCALPFQVPQPLVGPGLNSQVGTVPTLITGNTVLPGGYQPLSSLPSNQAVPLNSSSIPLVSPVNATAQVPAPGTNAIVQSQFPFINQTVLGNFPTAVAPNLCASNQVLKQQLNSSIAATNPSNSVVASNHGSMNLLAPQTLVVIPGINPLPQPSNLQNLNTNPSHNLTMLSGQIAPPQHTNIMMPNVIQNPALPLGQPGGMVLLPNATPTTVVIPKNTISQSQSNLDLPSITPLPSVAATTQVSESSKPTETVPDKDDDDHVNAKDDVHETEPGNIVQGSGTTAKATTVRGMLERKKMIMSKNQEEDPLGRKSFNDRQPFLPELLEDDMYTVSLDKLEEFTAAILGNKVNSRAMSLLPPNLSTLFSFKHLLIKKASLEKSAESFSLGAAQLQNVVDNVSHNTVAYKKYNTTDLQGNISLKEFLQRIYKLPIYALFRDRFIAYFLWPAFLSLLSAYPPKRIRQSFEYKAVKLDGRKGNGSSRKRKRTGQRQPNIGSEGSNVDESGEIQAKKNLKKKTSEQGSRSPKKKQVQVKMSVQPLRRGTRKTPLRKALPPTDQITAQEGT